MRRIDDVSGQMWPAMMMSSPARAFAVDVQSGPPAPTIAVSPFLTETVPTE